MYSFLRICTVYFQICTVCFRVCTVCFRVCTVCFRVCTVCFRVCTVCFSKNFYRLFKNLYSLLMVTQNSVFYPNACVLSSLYKECMCTQFTVYRMHVYSVHCIQITEYMCTQFTVYRMHEWVLSSLYTEFVKMFCNMFILFKIMFSLFLEI